MTDFFCVLEFEFLVFVARAYDIQMAIPVGWWTMRMADANGYWIPGAARVSNQSTGQSWSYSSNTGFFVDDQKGTMLSRAEFIRLYPDAWDSCQCIVGQVDSHFISGAPAIATPGRAASESETTWTCQIQ